MKRDLHYCSESAFLMMSLLLGVAVWAFKGSRMASNAVVSVSANSEFLRSLVWGFRRKTSASREYWRKNLAYIPSREIVVYDDTGYTQLQLSANNAVIVNAPENKIEC